ncbi:glycosyltransferase family 4 protein [Parvibium lacunae]|uniref:Glycosyltransferase n=1 Tax=Parvibium lacunae TaxID=1888893 RepID=A0A368L4F5_9BURK|nr:glycosyltransferase family 4 protein [Parvibium lacunae]RCS58312.1 glycosyltransferase [Parvibium lacunae]
MSVTALRILHTEASLGWGGQEIRILTESQGMQARGHQVWLCAPAQAQIYQKAAEYGVPASALPIDRKQLRGVWALRQWLKQQRVDVVNTHSSTDTWLAVLACLLLPKAIRPVIIRSRHISAAVNPSTLNRWLYGRAVKKVVTTGEVIRTVLCRDLALPASQVVSIPTGIDLLRFQPATTKPWLPEQFGFPAHAHVIGIVATLRSWKGHRYLLQALAQLLAEPPTQHCCVLIVGAGAGWQPLQTQIATLGLTGRVHLAGNQKDVVPYLQSMDSFCLPSYANEGIPQALLQAMACGLPIVTTAAGAIPELITHEKNGLVVPVKDASALAQALARLVQEPALAKTLAQTARQQALQQAGIETMLSKMESLMASVVSAASHGQDSVLPPQHTDA